VLLARHKQPGLRIELKKFRGGLADEMIGHDEHRFAGESEAFEFHGGGSHDEGLAGADHVRQECGAGLQDLPDGVFLMGGQVGPAQPAALPAPALTVSSDSTSGDRRNLSITVTPQREVRLIYLLLPGAAVARASVAGHEIPTSVFADGTGVVFNGPPDRDTSTGVTFDLELDEVMPVTVRVMDGSDGLDELPGFTPRPPGVGVQGSHTSELVLVAKTYTV